MKQPDIQLNPVTFNLDPLATRDFAAYNAKLQEILQFIMDHSGRIEIVATAPGATELDEQGDQKGTILSDVKILDNATQTNRKLYYKYKGNLRLIDSA